MHLAPGYAQTIMPNIHGILTAFDMTPSISSVEIEVSTDETGALPTRMDEPKADVPSTHAGMWPWISHFFALLWLVTLGVRK